MTSITTSEPSPHATATRVFGTVLWFSHKGFGYVRTDDGADVYVHHTAIAGSGFVTLPADGRVTCVVVAAPRGPEAAEVELIDP